jgi:hypothetical protein
MEQRGSAGRESSGSGGLAGAPANGGRSTGGVPDRAAEAGAAGDNTGEGGVLPIGSSGSSGTQNGGTTQAGVPGGGASGRAQVGGGGSGGPGASNDGTAGASGAIGAEAGGPAGDSCPSALTLLCGDHVRHSTSIEGRADTWRTYNATARAESGRETIYAFESGGDCEVTATLTNFTADLDLLLLEGCNPGSNSKASATPRDIEIFETIRWTSAVGETSYLVVDGYAGAEGNYLLQLECACN